ncbi:MarR family winged helix-turn-helix transcriptional regulator [Mangrovicoccus sp. HB161399]|uniref:MarR family winged helix-turn-helix transcriptional regulator n=1 Tax=Mangrovicoccus sp. HB161399 TaxID=2720392 RepID=UPI0015516FFF|nr:MarR family transcriptional regulator [Mangrovicoccus sp. HB161399]
MQSDSSSPREAFGFRFSTTARNWRRAVDQHLAAEGLTDTSWTLLIHLSEGGDGISQTALAQRTGVDTSSLVRLLDGLAASGFIERSIDPADRRARRIHLTAEGRHEIAAIRRRLEPIEARLTADLDDAALAQLVAALERIGTRIDEVLGTGTGDGK